MGAASSAYVEASRAREENQELWSQNQMLSDELSRHQFALEQVQGDLVEIKNDIARRKAIDEYQAWLEEFIYNFDKVIRNISKGSEDPIYDYGVIASFLDIINKNSLDTSSVRGLENKSAFEQTFLKAQDLFNQLSETTEVHNHFLQLRLQEEARLEEQRQADQQAEQQRLKKEREEREFRLEKERKNAELEQTLRKVRLEKEARHKEELKLLAKRLAVVCLLITMGGIIYSWRSQIYETVNFTFTRTLAEQGNIDAQAKLGLMYYEGKGVPKNYDEALRWFKMAAEKGSSSYSALQLASETGRIELVLLFLEQGADVDVKNKEGNTVLMFAASRGHLEILKGLLDKGADVNLQNNAGLTALMMVAEKGNVEAVKLLLGKGADVNEKDSSGRTALMAASGFGHLEVVKTILDNGGNVNAKDNSGNTALRIAQSANHFQVIRFLKARGGKK